MAQTSIDRRVDASIITELSILHEISSLRFSGAEEIFSREVVEKAARLFGVQRLALFIGNGDDRRLIASLACRDERDLSNLADQNQPNKGKLALGADGSIGTLYVEQEKPIDNRQWRLYNILARQLEQNLELAREAAERKRVQEALKESEERYRALVEAGERIGEAIIMLQDTVKTKAAHVFANQEWTRITGYSAEELEEISYYDLVHPRYRDAVADRVRRRMQGENIPGLYEISIVAKDGREVPVEVAAGNTAPYKGRPSNVGYIRDITERKRAGEEILKFKKIADIATYGLSLGTPEGEMTYVNESFARLHGYTPGELIGKQFNILYNEEQLKEIRRFRKKLWRNGSVFSEEVWHTRKDGSAFPTLTSANIVKDDDGNPLFIAGSVIDITERNKMEEVLRESEARLTLLYDEAPVGYHELDREGRMTRVNKTELDMLGYTAEEMLGRHVWDFMVESGTSSQAFAAKMAGTMPPGKGFERIYRRKDGATLPVLIEDRYVKDGSGQVIGLRSTIQDITERKRLQEQLQQRMEELDSAYSELKKIDQMKDNFLSTVSHELRTPLTSIKGFAEILLSYDEDKETQREFLTIINEESERLTRLIDDLLDLARLESGRQQWATDRIAITDIITQAVHAVHSLVTQKRLKIQTDLAHDLPYYVGDKDRLIQVVTNLLSNAIKFTPEKGEIRVKAELVKDTRPKKPVEAIRVSVSDTGIGIGAKDQKAIFERFKQVGDTMTDKPKGTGLGLPICKEIVEHYGGRMWVESESGKGSAFYFTLPLDKKVKAEVAAPKEKREAVTPKVGKTILVVDDEEHVRRFLSHEFTKRGYRVFEATNGQEAISLTRKQLPDLITLDVLMPELDGYDVTAILKNDPETKDIPILIISVVEDKQKAFHLGANDYLTKPFKIGMVMEKIGKLLRKAQKTVLVVDDDKALVKSLKYKLEKRGISTYIAYNGKEALQVVNKTPPNLILLDIIMPEMDGYEVMSRLKRNRKTAPIPIIILTGVEIDGGRVKALSLGADDYVTKTGGLNTLFENIETYINDH